MFVKIRQRKKLLILSAISVAAVSFAAGIALSPEPQTNNEPFAAEIITHSTSTPSEEKPDENFVWQGDLGDPRKITIPSVGIEGYIQKVGIDQNREIAVPNNVFLAGWFTESVRPGEKGLSIIDGHVDGRVQSEAIFSKLHAVQNGAEIQIEFGDGSSRLFRVFASAEATSADTPSILFSQNPNVTSQLNLITCIGTFDQATNRYDKRFVVSAALE